MNEMLESAEDSSFEALNNMMVLLESSIFDVQIMVSQAATTLFEVMGIKSIEIVSTLPLVEGGETVLHNLKELFYKEDEDLLVLVTEGNREIQWHELDISVQFEVVSRVHQKYVTEHRLSQMSQQEDLH